MNFRKISDKDMVRNVLAAYGTSWFWAVIATGVITALMAAAGMKMDASVKVEFLSAMFSWIPSIPVVGEFMAQSPGLSIFMALVFAPFVEEAIFRYFPLTFAIDSEKRKLRAVLIVVCGIFFGLAHGHALNVLIQGVAGYILGLLYVRNHRSQLGAYFSCVALHSMYNFTVLMTHLSF